MNLKPTLLKSHTQKQSVSAHLHSKKKNLHVTATATPSADKHSAEDLENQNPTLLDLEKSKGCSDAVKKHSRIIQPKKNELCANTVHAPAAKADNNHTSNASVEIDVPMKPVKSPQLSPDAHEATAGGHTNNSPPIGFAITPITNKQQLLMQSLTHFFTTNEFQFMHEFLNVTQSNAQISLRVIDWFVTNYSRDNDVCYIHPKQKTQFMVHDSYKSQLKAYSKRQFDPFCRRVRINFHYNKNGGVVVTTVGQLNFFRWALENHVVQYIRDNFKVIEQHMKKFVKTHREAKRIRKLQQKQQNLPSKYSSFGGSSSAGSSDGPAADAQEGDVLTDDSVAGTFSSKMPGGKTRRKSILSSACRRSISKHSVPQTVYFG